MWPCVTGRVAHAAFMDQQQKHQQHQQYSSTSSSNWQESGGCTAVRVYGNPCQETLLKTSTRIPLPSTVPNSMGTNLQYSSRIKKGSPHVEHSDCSQLYMVRRRRPDSAWSLLLLHCTWPGTAGVGCAIYPMRRDFRICINGFFDVPPWFSRHSKSPAFHLLPRLLVLTARWRCLSV